MFLVSCAYLSIRYFTWDIKARQTLCAIIAILNAVHVPIVYLSVNLWRSLHQPQTFVYAQHNASSDIVWCLLFNVATLFFLTIVISKMRLMSEHMNFILNKLRAQEDAYPTTSMNCESRHQ